MQTFTLSKLVDRTVTRPLYTEFLRVGTMSAGIYTLAAQVSDAQKPHQEDEIYYVIEGKAKIRVGTEVQDIAPGSIVFVPKTVDHRFIDIEADLVILVVFAPQETTA
jgi:mannose-6-phosphate isomerase-like protein (cupin superfamily)